MLFVLTTVQPLAQLLGQAPCGLVARDPRVVHRGDDRSEIAQVELVQIGDRTFGPVEPLGDADPWQQFLGQREHTTRADLGLAGRLQLVVLVLHGLAYRGDAAAQNLLRDDALLLGQGGEKGVAMGATGPQPLGLGTLGHLRHRRAGGTIAPRPFARSFAWRSAGVLARRAAGSTGTAAARAPVGSRAAVRTVAAGRAVAAVASRAVEVARGTVAAAGEHLCHRLERPLRHELDQIGALAAARRTEDLGHGDAVEIALDLGPQHVADLRAGRQERGAHHPARLLRAWRPPGPRPVWARARQLDLDPAGHGVLPYRTRAAATSEAVGLPDSTATTVGRMPVYALGDAAPRIDPTAFVHPDAVVIGSVTIGAEASVWPGAVLRGDEGRIEIGACTSIQDNCVLHTTERWPTIVGANCVVGHLVHLEGCIIEAGCLIGNGSIVLHRVVVRSGAIVAANAVVLNDTEVPAGALALGVPARIREGLARREEIEYGVETYRRRAARYASEMVRIG